MRKIIVFVSLISLIGPHSAPAQYKVSQDTLLDHLVGKWVLKGMIAGAQVTHDITVDWVLGHQYISMKETSREKQPDGKPSYEALILISRDSIKNRYDCLWLDNTSNVGLSSGVIAHADVKPSDINFLFALGDRSFFHTDWTYRVFSDSWHWKMVDDEKGKMEVFADAVMSRVP